MADDALTAAETHPFWLTYAHQHDSGRVCLLNQESDVWYIESGPGSGRVRAVCDRKHPEVSQVVREHTAAEVAAVEAEALRTRDEGVGGVPRRPRRVSLTETDKDDLQKAACTCSEGAECFVVIDTNWEQVYATVEKIIERHT